MSRHSLRTLSFTWMVAIPCLAVAQTVSEDRGETVQVFEGGSRPPINGPKPEVPQTVEAIVEGTNSFREEEGLSAFTVDPQLKETAEYFAEYMARTDRYGHTADDQQPAERAAEHGYEFCIVAENIAYQYSSAGFETQELAEKFVTGWKESPGHRRNMLDPDVLETGVAIAQSDETGHYYAVQMFGRPKTESVEFRIANESEVEVRYSLLGQQFVLPPSYERTHRMCRPSQAELQLKTSMEEDATPAETLRPKAGDRFVISGAGDDLSVKANPSE